MNKEQNQQETIYWQIQYVKKHNPINDGQYPTSYLFWTFEQRGFPLLLSAIAKGVIEVVVCMYEI